MFMCRLDVLLRFFSLVRVFCTEAWRRGRQCTAKSLSEGIEWQGLIDQGLWAIFECGERLLNCIGDGIVYRGHRASGMVDRVVVGAAGSRGREGFRIQILGG